MVNPDQTNWTEKLPMVKFALNSSTSVSSGFFPFELNYGFTPSVLDTPLTTTARGVWDFALAAMDNLLAAIRLIRNRPIAKLARTHRQAALASTGAMRTTATDAAEVLANLLPFHLLISKLCL